MMCDGMMMGIGMTVWLLVGLAVLAVLVLGIIWLVRQLRSPADARGGPRPDAQRELEMRYARGEVDRETYLAMRDDLARR